MKIRHTADFPFRKTERSQHHHTLLYGLSDSYPHGVRFLIGNRTPSVAITAHQVPSVLLRLNGIRIRCWRRYRIDRSGRAWRCRARCRRDRRRRSGRILNCTILLCLTRISLNRTKTPHHSPTASRNRSAATILTESLSHHQFLLSGKPGPSSRSTYPVSHTEPYCEAENQHYNTNNHYLLLRRRILHTTLHTTYRYNILVRYATKPDRIFLHPSLQKPFFSARSYASGSRNTGTICFLRDSIPGSTSVSDSTETPNDAAMIPAVKEL